MAHILGYENQPLSDPAHVRYVNTCQELKHFLIYFIIHSYLLNCHVNPTQVLGCPAVRMVITSLIGPCDVIPVGGRNERFPVVGHRHAETHVHVAKQTSTYDENSWDLRTF